MDTSLRNELLQVQLSRCGNKYTDMVNDYMSEIPSKMGKTVKRPFSSISRNISILSRYRGIMLYNLEKKFTSSLSRIRRYSR